MTHREPTDIEDDMPDLESQMDYKDMKYEEFKDDLVMVSNIWDALAFQKRYPTQAHRVEHLITAENLEKVRMVSKIESCQRAFAIEEAIYYIKLLDEVIEYIKESKWLKKKQ